MLALEESQDRTVLLSSIFFLLGQFALSRSDCLAASLAAHLEAFATECARLDPTAARACRRAATRLRLPRTCQDAWSAAFSSRVSALH